MTMILLVDDNRQSRYMLEVLLKAQGYEVALADHGAEALTLAVKHPPDLIITDILMPVMDGFALCRKWKADDRLRSIPFIFYTATYTEPQDERFALSLGAERFIIKPQQPEVLAQVVRDLLHDFQKGTLAPAEKPLGEEMEFFRRYNEVLFSKLEQKMIQLETANRRLERDVAERMHSVEALHQEQAFTDLVIDSLPGVFYICDEQGRLVRWNNNEKEVTGYSLEELMQMNVLQLFQGDRDLVASRIREVLETGRATVEASIVTKSGMAVPFLLTGLRMVTGGKRFIVGVGIDISERRHLEQQLRQAHKMEAVGLLAGGVAHDFNNILTAIIGYGNLAKMKLSADDPVLHYIDQILLSSDRAASLTNSLLAFSRKQIINPVPVNVNEIIFRIGKLLTRLIGEDIELKMDLEGRDLIILADIGQIEQVLMNLATNARDAMVIGGTMTIKTEQVILDQDFIKMHGYGNQGRYALLSVTDTGMGMDETTRTRIFEPFFTTKEVGKGTGLGLSMVYGIVKQHEGYITVASKRGIGTTFKIYLPLVQTQAQDLDVTEPLEARRGTETVLVAEDDDAVRNLVITLLTESGYTVISSSDGEQAVEAFLKNKDRIRLLILDLIMPRKNGKEAFEAIREIRPDIKVLFMSGYAADIFERRNIPEEGLNLLAKPISPTLFLSRVRETLDS
ncbi:MAG TPA: response regulator [Nitrospirota bacterium]|nr:response regulator [Nitrospirota bacterium]